MSSMLSKSPKVKLLGLLGDSHLYGARNFGALAAERAGCTTVGSGVPGATSGSVLANIASVQSADAVVVSVGTNNIATAPWGGLDDFGRQFPAILAGLLGKRIFCSTIIPFQNGHENHYLRAFNFIIKREAMRVGAEIFDAYEFFAEPVSSRVARDFVDLQHLSDQGNDFLASMLAYQMLNPLHVLTRFIGQPGATDLVSVD